MDNLWKIAVACASLGFAIAIIYERTTPPGGLSWQVWAVVAVLDIGCIVYYANAR